MTQKTILVIEDDEMLSDAMATVFGLEGWNTLIANDGVDGVQLALEHLPDLILSDINMPLLDGFGVLRRVRENPKTAAIPVIFVTAATEIASLQKQQGLFANEVVRKPFELPDLLKTIMKYLA